MTKLGDMGEWKDVRVYPDETGVIVELTHDGKRYRKRLTLAEALEWWVPAMQKIATVVSKAGLSGEIPFRIKDMECIDEGQGQEEPKD